MSTAAVAQEDTTGSDSTTVRIVARKLESGRIEFGLQQRQTDNTWGDRQLPRVRFFPTTATAGNWLASSALDLPVGEVRIVARKLESGRIEFGLQQRQSDNTWGDRRLPRVRFFPTTATADRWLASSTLTLTAPQTTTQSTGRYSAVTAGGFHSCGLRTNGTITCWGAYWAGQTTAPDGQYSAVTAGDSHSCGLRTNGTITCWGSNRWGRDYIGQADAPGGQYSAVTAGWRHSCALRTNGTITCWATTTSSRPTRPMGNTPPSPPAGPIRAGCAPTAPSPAGAGTDWGRRPRRPGSSPPSPPARSIRAGCAPTAPSPAGAPTARVGTTSGRRSRPAGNTPPSPPAATIRAAAHQRHHHLLGRERRGADDRARRAIHRRLRRLGPLVRTAHQRHHHLLGMEHLRAGDRARRAIHRHHRRRGSFVRAAHQRHHHLLGLGRIRVRAREDDRA